MRLIDGDRLIEYWKPDHDRTFTADYFIHTIEAQPTVSQWIPCSERLPEEDGRYLCSVGIGSSRLCMIYGFATDLHTVSRIDFEYSRGAGFYDHDSEYGYGETTEYVKAWQPLPSPYKEDTK